MALDRDVLNEQMRDGPVRTGVYMNDHRKTAVVVRVKEAKAYFLTSLTGTIELQVESVVTFGRSWPIFLPNYPARRAARHYQNSGLAVEASAGSILRSVLGS